MWVIVTWCSSMWNDLGCIFLQLEAACSAMNYKLNISCAMFWFLEARKPCASVANRINTQFSFHVRGCWQENFVHGVDSWSMQSSIFSVSDVCTTPWKTLLSGAERKLLDWKTTTELTLVLTFLFPPNIESMTISWYFPWRPTVCPEKCTVGLRDPTTLISNK